jgi:uncharacterized protein YfaT (DUF1175 family)
MARPLERVRWWVVVSVGALLAAGGIGFAILTHGPAPGLELTLDRTNVVAGGATVRVNVRSSIPLPSSGMEFTIAQGTHSARVARAYFESGEWRATIASKGLAGKVTVRASLEPFAPAVASFDVLPGDPDKVLRLDDPADEAAFRSWFTYLAEAQFFRETRALPAEISDCAGLIRYCYRESLRLHDSAWAQSLRLSLVPAIPSVRKYEYPATPWGAALFRTGPASTAEFADAETLMRFNTRFVSRDVRQALPGDLIFFHQDDAAMPYHSMIFLGPSQIENARGPFVAYHTGGSGEEKGEVRRPAVEELRKHPDPAWQLTAENSHYLGVYRWNVLWQ